VFIVDPALHMTPLKERVRTHFRRLKTIIMRANASVYTRGKKRRSERHWRSLGGEFVNAVPLVRH